VAGPAEDEDSQYNCREGHDGTREKKFIWYTSNKLLILAAMSEGRTAFSPLSRLRVLSNKLVLIDNSGALPQFQFRRRGSLYWSKWRFKHDGNWRLGGIVHKKIYLVMTNTLCLANGIGEVLIRRNGNSVSFIVEIAQCKARVAKLAIFTTRCSADGLSFRSEFSYDARDELDYTGRRENVDAVNSPTWSLELEGEWYAFLLNPML
jgi:hypothetical protein